MRKMYTFVIGLVMILGIALLSYPSVSNFLMERHSTRAILHYTLSVEQMNQEEIKKEWEEAEEYNRLLKQAYLQGTSFSRVNRKGLQTYARILNVEGEMGYIDIPAIDVYLPIYHGTSEAVLREGIGHMPNTAFPLGSPDSHAVLTGHSGLSKAVLFTELRQMQKGDIFFIHILDMKIKYVVDHIAVVLPHDTRLLEAKIGRSDATLITCTPYGMNTHRLLVRGAFDSMERMEEEVNNGQEANQMTGVILIVGTFLLFGILRLFYLRYRRKRVKMWLER